MVKTSTVFAMSLPKSAIQFTENKGQWEPNVLYKADIPVGNLFIEKNVLTYLFIDKEAAHERQHGKNISKARFHSVKVKFVGANPQPEVVASMRSDEYYNYFVGHPSKWASNVYAYKKLLFKEIYPKIDLEILAQGDGIKINFIIHPGANPSVIHLEYTGADRLFLKNQQLRIQTSLGEMVEDKPISYQQIGSAKTTIATQFVLYKNHVGFKVANYSKDKDLILDPAVVFGTYMGSAADNFGFAASYDNLGNAYGAGTVYAANFPFTTGAYDISFNGGSSANGEYARDAFIAKFNPTGTSLLYGTFIGGSDNEQPHSVTFSNGELIIFGTTYSANFPVTNRSYDNTFNGNADIFVLKLNAAGNTLLGSTYIGGSQEDGINGDAHQSFPAQTHSLPYNYADWFRGEVITDLAGNIYVSTCSKSSQTQGLPLVNASQSTFGGGMQDGYIVKLNKALSNILFSTYIGGSGDETANSICINNLNEPIIGGGSTSNNLQFGTSNFPFSGGVDGFIAKFSSNGAKQRLIYTGSSGYDQVFFVQTDESNNIYTMGQTNGNMPKSAGTYGVANGKQFLEKYSSDLTSRLLSTTFGKAGGSEPSLAPSAFLVDVCGRIYVSGWGGGTNSSYHNGLDNVFGLTTSSDAFQKTTDGSDFYLMVLNQNFSNLLYASFYGGIQSQEHVDGGTSHFDKSGVVYQAVCAGCGGLNDFPTTPDAYSRINPGKRAFNTNIGGCNLGLFKFDMRTYIIPPQFQDTLLVVYAGQNLTYNFSATDPGGDILTVEFTGDVLTRPDNKATITINSINPGNTNATLVWNTLCSDYTGPGDTIIIEVKVTDGACPVPNEKLGKIKILVRSEPISPPYLDCIRIVDDVTLNVTWINATPDPNFLNYQIYRKKNNGPFTLIDSIPTMLGSSYLDKLAPNNLDTNYCYQIIALNRCRVKSDSSRLMCSIVEGDTSSNAHFTGIETERYVLNAFDTFTYNFSISDINALDSVYLKPTGSFMQNGKGKVNFQNGLGIANMQVSWIPTCTDIYADTLELLVVVRDNSCPNIKQANKRILFYVLPTKPIKAPVNYCPKKISNDSVLIEWPLVQTGPFTKTLYLFRTVNSVRSLVASFDNLSTQNYVDVFNYNPNLEVCYSFTSSDICGYFGDTSTLSCIQDNNTPAPSLTLYTVTVVDDKEIQLVWEKAVVDSFWRYQVLKKKDRNTALYELISEVRNVGDTSFIDEDVKVDDHSYCYKLVNVDVCGNSSINNKEACSILLKGDAVPFTNNMNWLPYEYWSQGINRYELLKTEPGLYTDNLFKTLGEKPLFSSDNNLNYDNGLYQYTVVAYENIFANKQMSRSNTIDLIQLPILYTPNAYTENGDGLNDQFHTVPVFVKDYHLQIYNRWGERIFETYDKKEGFSGIYKGKESQTDVYFYIVTYTGWDESRYIRKGNFTLLR